MYARCNAITITHPRGVMHSPNALINHVRRNGKSVVFVYLHSTQSNEPTTNGLYMLCGDLACVALKAK